MSGAAFTPRVRTLAVCDEASSNEIEVEVFTLENVRYGFGSESFPCARSLWVYLLLSYPRGGRFQGEVKLFPSSKDKLIRVSKFSADFDVASGVQALVVEMNNCTFEVADTYWFRVYFQTQAGEVLKKEEPFEVWHLE